MKKRIIAWLKRQVREAGAKGIVLGLSGGVDSAVAASLAKEAVGKSRVLGLVLPCHSHAQDLKDASLVARKLGIKLKVIDLSKIYDNITGILPKANSLSRANIKPRLRMMVLYYFANQLNYLVCGTGNKSELMVGYFTKHGDGATDLLPIGALLKRQVRALAQELGVPENIIAKPPTAGLWPGQTDEGEMGVTYNELDDILERLLNKRKQVAPQAKLKKITSMVKSSEHKRQGPKICYL
ncbi:MAG: NAD+ synthase [Candidatus Omnitrophica bacterium]|nr:NAD+ synthase [Candidatus Omnitrophota bacterium]